MHEQDDQTSQVHFGVFEVDLRRGELRKHGLKIKLHGQPTQILAMLLQRPGELVTREEIREKLWPRNTFVDFEHSVNTSIKRLREALGDNASSPRFIETLPRHGYRFIAPVEILGSELHSSFWSETPLAPDSENSSAEGGLASVLSNEENGLSELRGNARDHGVIEPKANRRTGLKRAWVLLMAAVAVAGLFAVLFAGKLRDSLSAPLAPSPTFESIAVLPLENLSHDPEQDYFADGMTEELITNLGKIGALRVVSRTSVMHYKGTKESVPEIAKELNVDAVVEGTVLRSGDQIRITANLLDAKTDRHIWAESYERDLRDVLSLQDELARTIAEQIKIKLTAQEMARLSGSPSVSPEAYRLNLQARFHCYKRTLPELEKSVQLFQQALAEDPEYASAYAGLAESYGLLPFYGGGSSRDIFPKAKAAALRAVKLNDSLAEAHAALGFVLLYGDWDWTGADRELRRAIELNPSYPTTHHWYAEYLSVMGRNDKAVAEIRRAQELDPLSALLHAIGAEIYTNARRYDECVGDSKKALELDPNFALAHENLAGCLLLEKLYKEAGAEYMEAGRIWGTPDSEVMVLGYALSGRRADAIRTLERSRVGLDFPARTSIIQIRICLQANLCTKEEALDFLEKAYSEHEAYMPFLNVHPAFDLIHSEPRFQNILRRMNFPHDDH